MNKKLFFISLLAVQFMAVFSLKAADYTYLGLVGNATVINDWVPQGIPMVKSAVNDKLFTYTGFLKSGELKIHTQNADWGVGDWIMPVTNGQSITDASHIIVLEGDATDNKWQVTSVDEGIYAISINVEDMSVSFTKVDYYPNLYLVGDATPGGWSLDNATAMTVDAGNPAIFTWTGNLTSGNFKIATTLTFEGNFDWIHPLSNAQSLVSTDATFVLSGGSSTDYQWAIGGSDEGLYEVTVNMAGTSPTVQFVKTGPLPLNFLSFTAKLDNSFAMGVTLNWKTANEVNVQSFDIERSADGKTFETIGNIPAKNVSGINYYAFKDKNALERISYYRLKQLDKDGKYSYSSIISADNKESLKFSVYPNPCTDYLRLNYAVTTSETELNIINVKGEKVISQKITAGTVLFDRKIDISAIVPGYYIVILKDGKNTSSARFIK